MLAIKNAEPKEIMKVMNHDGGEIMSTLEKRFSNKEIDMLMEAVQKKIKGKGMNDKEHEGKNPFDFGDLAIDALDFDDLDDDMVDTLLDELDDLDIEGDEFSMWGAEPAWGRKKRSVSSMGRGRGRDMKRRGTTKKKMMSMNLKQMMMADKNRKASPFMRDVSRFLKELIFTQDEEPRSMIGSRLSTTFRSEIREVLMLFLNEDMPMDVLDASRSMFKRLGKVLGKQMKGMLPITKAMIKETMNDMNTTIKNKTLSEDPEVARTWSWVAGVHSAVDDEVQARMASVLARMQGNIHIRLYSIDFISLCS